MSWLPPLATRATSSRRRAATAQDVNARLTPQAAVLTIAQRRAPTVQGMLTRAVRPGNESRLSAAEATMSSLSTCQVFKPPPKPLFAWTVTRHSHPSPPVALIAASRPDDWVEAQGFTCQYIETQGCDCAGCSCPLDGVPGNCPATCHGNTCDEVLEAYPGEYTCSFLENNLGCDCGNCACEDSIGEPD